MDTAQWIKRRLNDDGFGVVTHKTRGGSASLLTVIDPDTNEQATLTIPNSLSARKRVFIYWCLSWGLRYKQNGQKKRKTCC